MSGRHPSLEKLSRERLRFQRLAMSSPSEFVGSPMTELAANLNDVAHIMSPEVGRRRRLSMDSSSPGTPLSTITNLVRNTRGKPHLSPMTLSAFNKENLLPKTSSINNSESEDESSKDSGFCGSSSSSTSSAKEEDVDGTSINQTLAELHSRPESEPLACLPDDSPSKADGFDLIEEDFTLDDTTEDMEDEENNDENNPAINISTLIHNKVLSPPKEIEEDGLLSSSSSSSSHRPKPNLLASPLNKRKGPHQQHLPFRRSLSLKEREKRCILGEMSSSNILESPVSRMHMTTFKRPTSPAGERLIIKRRKIYDSSEQSPKHLNRSFSEVSFSSLISAGLSSSAELTGDMSRPVLFPILPPSSEVKHHDLKPIDADTLARLLKGEFDKEVESFRIIDARYVYEFEGGHIQGAENFGSWDEATFFDEFLPLSKKPLALPYSPESKRKIIIFHCEFSSVRGPELMKKLRQKDRCLNRDTYPALHYPECYLLHKGYKEFFRLFPELCEPQSYRSMADPNYQKDAKAFHKKSKSWAGGTVARTRHTSRPLNL